MKRKPIYGTRNSQYHPRPDFCQMPQLGQPLYSETSSSFSARTDTRFPPANANGQVLSTPIPLKDRDGFETHLVSRAQKKSQRLCDVLNSGRQKRASEARNTPEDVIEKALTRGKLVHISDGPKGGLWMVEKDREDVAVAMIEELPCSKWEVFGVGAGECEGRLFLIHECSIGGPDFEEVAEGKGKAEVDFETGGRYGMTACRNLARLPNVLLFCVYLVVVVVVKKGFMMTLIIIGRIPMIEVQKAAPCFVLTFVCNALVRAQISHSADTTQDQASSSTADAISQWRKESSDNGSHGKPASSDVHVLEIDRQLGVLQVQEAFSILETVDSPRSRLARFERSSGFVGTTVYYAKEAFILLFMNDSPQEDYLDPQPHEHKLSKPLGKAVKLLETAARQNNSDALFLLAEMSFYGNYSYPRDYKEAFRRYQDLSSLNGNSTAQYMLGFMYATGIGGSTERDQAKAMLYHTFAAANGNTRSEMTTAYRHHAGIGTPRNCNEASVYYKRVAEKAIAYSRSGPPGGVMISRDSYRLADEQGGVYGEGASVASSGVHANKAGPSSDQHAAFDDVLEYLDLMSRKGDLKATFSLGRLHYEGSRTMRRNLKSARAYFMIVARKYWAKDGSLLSDDAGIGKIASKAAGYIGRMFLRGEGMEQSFEKALTWFKRGIENGDSLCQYELGLMYLEGLGVRKDAVIAANYFKAAADQDFASAEIRLGQLLLDQGDLQAATRFFDMAIRHGHIEAFYHLAEMSNNGVGRERSCGLATAYYKVVAEKAEAIHSSFEEANRAYKDGDKENALVEYMMAAEQGYENGQANVAYILDEHKSILSLDKLMPWKKPPSALLRNTVLALIYWTRSAKQANIDSMVKMGDYYLGGYGAEADMEKAATCYHTASEMQQSAQALWNLGWMYENGIGVEQDFHLAKRFYDQALETNQEAYLPVKLSLLKLRMRSFWNTITYGKVNSIQSEPELKKDWSVGEWISNFLEDDHPHYHSADGDEGPPDSMNDAMPDGDDYYDEIDEGIIESLIIVGLAAALAFLVYYRQQRQTNHRRAVEQRGGEANAAANVAPQGQPLPGQQADGGFFPPPGDPNYGQWVAGGIGH